MILLAVKLLIAHIVGDFVFQPDHWVAGKRDHKHKSRYFYLHGLVHLVALLVVLEFDFSYWPYILLIVLSHLLIDLVKLNLNAKLNSRMLFALDQIAHLLVIALVVYILHPYTLTLQKLYSAEVLLLALAILFTSYVSAILMKIVLSRWEVTEENPAEGSLKNAGKYIGMLERLFVFGFIILNQWSAIGLLITAKSVFRFSDLNRAKDRKLTEYILIGTLMSFGLAILTALFYKYLLNYI
ncbi:DUF3307 domain-containing protein [Flavimarina sp. Hel_I_48]|uniref:DUF3307 domain-containing protein n=1 Tax=Flavimarina sp. Hel_I_48 TaxID=1392488 RepID=UPI0004DFBAC3|nr:DUF3307 domain-containing protein [Flavimarina sp. Hel_I_48]